MSPSNTITARRPSARNASRWPSLWGASTALLLAFLAALFIYRMWVVQFSGISLFFDEAQYWDWAQDLDWGYYSKPPGIAALIWVSTRLFGDGLLGVKALAMGCYPLAAAACWAIAARLYDRRTAFWSALAVLTLPPPKVMAPPPVAVLMAKPVRLVLVRLSKVVPSLI